MAIEARMGLHGSGHNAAVEKAQGFASSDFALKKAAAGLHNNRGLCLQKQTTGNSGGKSFKLLKEAV